jgi:hypothetical protein
MSAAIRDVAWGMICLARESDFWTISALSA